MNCESRFDFGNESHRRPKVYVQQDYFYNPKAVTNLMDLVMDNCIQCVILRMAKKALRLVNNEEDFYILTTPNISAIRIRPGRFNIDIRRQETYRLTKPV